MENQYLISDFSDKAAATNAVVFLDEQNAKQLKTHYGNFDKLANILFVSNLRNSPYFITDQAGLFSLLIGISLAKAKANFIITSEESELYLLSSQQNYQITVIEADFVDKKFEEIEKLAKKQKLKDIVLNEDFEVDDSVRKVKVSKAFKKTVVALGNYLIENQPRTFISLFNSILNKANVTGNHINKENGTTLNERQLSFLIFAELLDQNYLVNDKIRQFIRQGIIYNIDQIEGLYSGIQVNAIAKKPEMEKKKPFVSKSVSDINVLRFNELSESSKFFNGYVHEVRQNVIASLNIRNLSKFPATLHQLKNYIVSFLDPKVLTKLTANLKESVSLQEIISSGVGYNLLMSGLIMENNNNLKYNLVEIEKFKKTMKEELAKVIEE